MLIVLSIPVLNSCPSVSNPQILKALPLQHFEVGLVPRAELEIAPVGVSVDSVQVKLCTQNATAQVTLRSGTPLAHDQRSTATQNGMMLQLNCFRSSDKATLNFDSPMTKRYRPSTARCESPTLATDTSKVATGTTSKHYCKACHMTLPMSAITMFVVYQLGQS